MRFSRYLEGRVGLPSKRNKFVLALQYVARLKNNNLVIEVMGREMQRKHQLGTPEPVSNLSGGPGGLLRDTRFELSVQLTHTVAGGPMSPSMGGMEDADALES
eukprot:2274600-Amphidinium_carterae.2